MVKWKKEKNYTFLMKLEAIWYALFGKKPVIMTYEQLKTINKKILEQKGRIENLEKQLEKYMGESLKRYYKHI